MQRLGRGTFDNATLLGLTMEGEGMNSGKQEMQL